MRKPRRRAWKRYCLRVSREDLVVIAAVDADDVQPRIAPLDALVGEPASLRRPRRIARAVRAEVGDQ
jgi:hypothetical protein